jgi:hypothetical protein
MQRFWFKLLPTILCCLLSPLAALGTDLVRMQTINANTEVYDRPSFSGRVVERLKMQSTLDVSPKKIVGPDGIGAFYEFKNASGQSVYIADSELNPVPKIQPPAAPVVAAPIEPARKVVTKLKTETPAQEPTASPASQLGVHFGVINYAEKYNETKYQAARPSIGLTHQNFLDYATTWSSEINLMFSPGAPKFLVDAGAQGQSSGYLLILDYELLAHYALTSNLRFRIGGGLALINSNFTTTVIGEAYTSQSTRAGAVMGTGLSYTTPNWTLSWDLRQHFEKESYLGSQISLLISTAN